jgi:hypothetical protein
MTKRLLDRQASLLDYLSSAAAMFGSGADVPVDPALRAFDSGVLRLQARFICNKRIEKIVSVFPRTLQILGADQRSILREFVEAGQSTNKSTLANAQEFHEFLARRWQRVRPRPACLRDVAACELAMAEARDVASEDVGSGAGDRSARRRHGIRRRRDVIALRCAYDVRAVFDASSGDVAPRRRAISLVATVPAGSGEARLIETTSRVVAALSLLDEWADPSALDEIGDRESLIAELAAKGFIEALGRDPPADTVRP